MLKMKDIFQCLSGNSDLTEEFIYRHISLDSSIKYEVLSSSTDEFYNMGYVPMCKNGKNKNIKVFENKQGILVARNGKAGTMRYLTPGYYTINDHAYILYLKDSFVSDYKMNPHTEEIFLKYFMFMYELEVKSFSTNNDNATWNKTAFYNTFEIDEISNEQLSLFSRSLPLLENTKFNLNKIYFKLNKLEHKIISLNLDSDLPLIPISNIFKYCSRNDCLSEEGIYNRRPTDEYITVLSGASNNIFYGKVNKRLDRLHYVENKQCLHLISRGNAGRLTYLSKGDYATNTNAFLLYFKSYYKEKYDIDTEFKEEVLLKYFMIYLQPVFYEISSKSDLGVFPLTDIMSSLEVPDFMLSDNILSEIKIFNEYIQFKESVYNINKQFNMLLSKQIYT